ncbi:MAG: N-acetyl-gamma-glutamyl-phosphate reductase [Dehalococcoidia bacterium]
MKKAQIVGATGYGGLGMTELLLRHPHIEITSLLATQDVGKPISEVYSHLRGFCDMTVEAASEETVGRDADVVIFATPDGVGQSYAPALLERGLQVIDYSGDFRFATAEQYAEYARRHPSVGGRAHACPDLLPHSVYGMPELNRERLRGARLVGNPGCFAVSMILGLAPAAAHGLIEPDDIVIDGKTGISGAGKKPSASYHFPAANESVSPYRIGSHQHPVETEMTVGALMEAPIDLTFVPHLIPVTRGIICTIYARLRDPLVAAEVQSAYEDFYAEEPFVRVLPPGVSPGIGAVLGSNLCDVSVTVLPAQRRLIVAASIDNLLKGQAGVALQNLNLMLGFPETTGLERVPIYP